MTDSDYIKGHFARLANSLFARNTPYVEFDIIVRSLLSGLDREYEPPRIDSKRAIILASVCSCSDLIFGDHTDSNPLAELDRMYTVPSK